MSLPGTATVTGTVLNTSDTVELDLAGGAGAALFSIVGTVSADIEFQGSLDSTNWIDLVVADYQTGACPLSSTGSSGTFVCNTAGLQKIRVLNSSNQTSGAITITITATFGASGILAGATGYVYTLPGSGGVYVNTIGDGVSPTILATVTAGNALKTDASATTQPVSGTFFQATQPVSGTFFQTTQPISAAALPLPSGASTSGLQTTGNTSLSSIDGKITAVNTGAVVISSSALPSGAATGTKQDAGNTSLSSIDTKTLVAGQAVMAASSPVVIASNQTSIPVAATLAAETTKVIGTVNVASGQTIGLAAGSAVIGHVINDASSAVIGHVIVDSGAVNATLSAETTKVIGTVNVAASQTIAVTNAGTFAAQTTIAAGATSIAKVEDTASADADVGVPAMAIRKATPANTSGTDGDYEMLQMSAGRLWTSATIDAALPAGTNAIGKLSANSGVIIGDVNVVNSNVSTNIAQMNGVATTMGNGISGAGVQRVTIASDSTGQLTLAAGAATIGALTANQSINNAQIAGVATSTGNGVVGTGVQRVAIASDNTAFSVNATPPTLTKGSQAATGYSVQSLKDAGRTSLCFYATAVAAGLTTTETAITLTKSPGTAATSTGTSFVITNAKRFRISYISLATRANVTATAQTTLFNFRLNTAGAVTTSSTPVLFSVRSDTPATANAVDRVTIDIPDGYEILGDGTIQFGITAASTYLTNAPTWDVLIVGYEY